MITNGYLFDGELINNAKIDRNKGAMLPESVIDIIATIIGEIPGKVLIPNNNYGELALGQQEPTRFTTTENENNFLYSDISEQFEKIIMLSPIGWQKG